MPDNRHHPSFRFSKKIIKALIIIIVLIGAAVLMLNNILTGPVQKPAVQTNIKPADKSAPQITRQSFLEPRHKFYLNTIFANNEKIAEFKSEGDKILDLTGTIPDGKVEFTNLSLSSHGYEYFHNNVREGEYKEYHSKGNIWFEKSFENGRLMTITEYFEDGGVRMKADYSNALQTCETKDNGSGIVYRHNGKPMYEWHLTGADTNRYKKFYDSEGGYQGTQYFDIKGRLIKDMDATHTESGEQP